jgi:hypothetical protein
LAVAVCVTVRLCLCIGVTPARGIHVVALCIATEGNARVVVYVEIVDVHSPTAGLTHVNTHAKVTQGVSPASGGIGHFGAKV